MRGHGMAIREQSPDKSRARCPKDLHGERRPVPGRTALCRAFRGGAAVRWGIVLVCLAAALAGCSSGQQAAVEQLAGVSATAEHEPGNVGPPPGVGDWVRPPLAGMWVDHPERMSPSHGWLHATVSVEPPCVYLTNVSQEFVRDSFEQWEGRRLVLSLLYPQVRFDESTQSLWSPWREDVDIPIAHGDRVIVSSDPFDETIGGKEPSELHLFWDVCAAHARAKPAGIWTSVEWLCLDRVPGWVWHEGQKRQQLCVEDTRPWNQRDLLEQQGVAPVGGPTEASGGDPPPTAGLALPQFFGMHPYHPDMELEVSKLVGILSIESPRSENYERVCAYLYPTAAAASRTVLWGDAWKHTSPDGLPLAVRLDLPYPQVRYDAEAGTLWNGDIGPMASGDRIIADPVAPPDFNDSGYGNPKQPHEPVINDPCDKASARADVLDIQTIEHYCTHTPPARHHSQCQQAMNQHNQTQNHLTPPPDTAD